VLLPNSPPRCADNNLDPNSPGFSPSPLLLNDALAASMSAITLPFELGSDHLPRVAYKKRAVVFLSPLTSNMSKSRPLSLNDRSHNN
jgi:hypothetical protein